MTYNRLHEYYTIDNKSDILVLFDYGKQDFEGVSYQRFKELLLISEYDTISYEDINNESDLFYETIEDSDAWYWLLEKILDEAKGEWTYRDVADDQGWTTTHVYEIQPEEIKIL